jgi:RNA recognition motif-containing protein
MSRNAPMRDWSLDCKIYVGDLGYGCAKQELEEKFSKYGQLRNVWVARKPPGFAFVEFEDSRDAEDTVRALDGAKINGRRVRVEMSSGRSRWGNRGAPPRGGNRQQNDSYRSGSGGGSGRKSRRSRSHSMSESPKRRSRSRS